MLQRLKRGDLVAWFFNHRPTFATFRGVSYGNAHFDCLTGSRDVVDVSAIRKAIPTFAGPTSWPSFTP
jgi:hypothetical protein